MTHLLGNVLRNLAVVLVNLAERVDPQPPIEDLWMFHRQTSTGTNGADVYITLHQKPHETG
jgi:hypothetical protein